MTEHGGGDGDHSAAIIAALHAAHAGQSPVYISGGGSKRHMIGRQCEAVELDVSAHRGIVDYQPRELVITARAGTPLTEIVATLAEQHQMMSFEPPLFDGRATLGGTLACNLCGPARPWGGAIRDTVLGVQLINGKCERLNFGGRVMKNVAGYDVSRLQAGALGTLGVLSEVCLKVLPRPQQTRTLRFAMPADDAILTMNRRAGEPQPLSGAFWLDGLLYLRLSGAASAVNSAARQWCGEWGGECIDDATVIWDDLREMTLPFFAGEAPLWRLSLQSSARFAPDFGATLIDWGGAQRWVRGQQSREHLERTAAAAGGHVTLFRGGDRSSDVRPAQSAVEQKLQRRLKHSFDPDGLLNPGRLYSWL